MDNRLFFVSDGKAKAMNEQPYEKEAELQKIVQDNPDLLTRAWNGDGRRLFLVKRELEIMEAEDSANSYSMDHLLVGEDAVPVLVEVKRASDTRIRREVVAQMFDYACRASTWNVDKLRELFKASNANEPEIISEFDDNDFWDAVATNLDAEHFRIVFVADEIPDTLRVLIEFFDRSLKNIEVYGVEIKQYVSGDALLLSSNIVGNSPLVTNKVVSRGKVWDANSFAEGLRECGLEEAISVAMDLKDFASALGVKCAFGKGQRPSFTAKLGGVTLFAASTWIRKPLGYTCTLDFAPKYLADDLGSEWNEKRVRELLTSMPGKGRSYDEHLIWDTPYYLYMDLRALLDERDRHALKSALRTLRDAIAGEVSDAAICEEKLEISTPSPAI